MDISVDLFYNDGEEASSTNMSRLRRRLRDSSNPLDLPDSKFISFFRINKDAFCYLLNQIESYMQPSVRGTAIPPILKLSCALRFFAEGSYQKGSGNDFNVGFAQPTVSVILSEILNAIENKICPKWIRAQMTEEEKTAAKRFFYSRTGMPGVIGCIDGTHVRIIAPKRDVQHLYLNRKGYYSLNVMILCDHNMKIRYVDARHPGSNHDSFVWNTSHLKEYLRETAEQNTWILGDAGYPLDSFIMTPFRNSLSGSQESQFNTVHASARNIVERTIGVLKNTFRCLLSVRGLHYSPEKATNIINVCCALHNLNKEFKTEFPEEPQALNNDELIIGEDITDSNSNAIAREMRNNLMRTICNQ